MECVILVQPLHPLLLFLLLHFFKNIFILFSQDARESLLKLPFAFGE